jgi:hypothetical protein
MGFQVNLLAPSVDLVSPRGDLLGLLHRLPHRSLHQLPLCFDYCSHGQAAYSRGFLAVSNESVIVPMARSSLVQKPLPLLNALMLFSGRIHLHLCLCPCPQTSSKPFLHARSTPHSSNSMVALWHLAFTWEAIWWRLSELRRRQSIYSLVARCGLHGPIAPS